MKWTYDPESDAAYLYLKSVARGEAKTTVPGRGAAEGINLDFDAQGRLLGIEVLDARRKLPAGIFAKISSTA